MVYEMAKNCLRQRSGIENFSWGVGMPEAEAI